MSQDGGKIFYAKKFPLRKGDCMKAVAVGEKGRVTLPLNVRKTLGIEAGDEITIEVRGNEVVLKPKHHVSVKESKGSAKLGRVKLEEVEEALGK